MSSTLGAGVGPREMQRRGQRIEEPVQVESTSTLNSGSQFISSAIDVSKFGVIVVAVETNQNGEIKLQWSDDGTTFQGEDGPFTYNASDKRSLIRDVAGKFVKVIFDNTSGSNQTNFDLWMTSRRI